MTSLRLVLDLDQTLIHALDQSECPANAKEIADCVVPVCHNGLEFDVAVRRGATRLVQQWKARRDVEAAARAVCFDGELHSEPRIRVAGG